MKEKKRKEKRRERREVLGKQTNKSHKIESESQTIFGQRHKVTEAACRVFSPITKWLPAAMREHHLSSTTSTINFSYRL